MVDILVSADQTVAAQVLLDGAQEVLGPAKLHEMIKNIAPDAFSAGGTVELARIDSLMAALEETYGAPGGRGLALRIGRAAFHYGLKQFGSETGLRTQEFRLQPAQRRLESGLKILAGVVAVALGEQVILTDEGSYWQWRVVNYPFSQDPDASGPACYLTVGLLQEFTSWAEGGRYYQVVETECRVSGGQACVYKIEKKPLD